MQRRDQDMSVAESLGAFAVEAADGQAQLVDGLDDLIDLLAEDQAGQVEHGGGAHPGADVGGAGGEIAEGRGEGELDLFLQSGVQLIGCVPRLLQMEAGAKGLQAKVILLVDHDGKGFIPVHHQAAAGVLGGVFPGDEMLFDKELFFQRPQGLHGHGHFGRSHHGQVAHGGLDGFKKL